MESEPKLDARNSLGIDEKDVPIPVMPAIPIMATPVLPIEKIRAMSFAVMSTEQDELQDIENMGHRYDPHLIPVFEKRAAATILEIFYDFWIVANLGIFMSVHSVSDPAALWSYIGYISIVWFTWFLVGCFDVRYVTDSIFERIARTLHLGVVVGFGVVAPNYDPAKQNKGTWQCMSLILMVSRLVLVLEYSTILWHIRKFKQGKLPLLAALVFHFIAAMVYLGVSFRFEDGRNSHAYIAWYVVMALEAIVQLGLSLYSNVLSFNGTHLAERMTILTMFILGEGVMVIMDGVVNIVKNNGWTGSTIGVLISAVGTVYFVFMLYNDWMTGYASLANWRQAAWSILHYPFHVLLLLFIKGATQFMIWWKVTQVESKIVDQFAHAYDHMDVDYITSEDVVSALNTTIQAVWVDYKPVWGTVLYEIQDWFDMLRTINDTEWNIPNEQNTPEFWDTWDNALYYLRIAVVNSVFGNFKIDAIQDLYDAGELDNLSLDEANTKAYDNTTERFYLVFQYVFACSGMALIIMTILYLIIKRQPTSRRVTVLFYIRTAIFFILGIGLSLVTLLSLDWEGKGGNYLYTPWLLPTLCFVFFLLILLTHIPRPPPAVVFSRLPNPMNAWNHISSHHQPTSGGGATEVAAQEPGAFQRMRDFASSKKNNASYAGSHGGSGGEYSQVHVTESSSNPGSLHDQTAATPPFGTTVYDPHSWNGQQQQQQSPPVSTEYYGAAGFNTHAQQQQPAQQYEQYRQYPQQPGAY